MSRLLLIALIALPCLIQALPQQGKAVKAGNLVEVLSADPRFAILVLAVTKADLAGVLSGEGPFTVLAPVAEAFEGMDLDELLSDVEALTAILLRHVIAASVYAADVTDGPVETVGGDIITASTESGVTFSFGSTVSTVIEADIEASNGVIHAIDTVIA